MPDGKPLELEYYVTPTAKDRELSEVWKKSMNAVGIKIVFKMGRWPEHLKAGRAGKLMMWGLASSASSPDGGTSLERAYGPFKGEANLARFQNAEFDTLYRQQLMMPDGPERLAILQKLAKIMVAYMPYKVNTHRIRTDVMQPWLIGYRRHPTSRAFWRYVDIDLGKLPKQ
jgi:ABC-type transport system substrate-binding protein